MKHIFRVATIIRDQPEQLQKLFEAAPPDTRKGGHGPRQPEYSIAKHKQAVYLSGANVLLLQEMVRKAKMIFPDKKDNKITKSAILNRMIEDWLIYNSDDVTPILQQVYIREDQQ